MRSEKEILNIILYFAEKDTRVRAVSIAGSRANPTVNADLLQDYDISYFVTEMDSFISDKNWIDVFGERIIMQTPEAMSLFAPELGNWFSYLMLFKDRNRIDLTLIPVNEVDLYYKNETFVKILMDKDRIFPNLSASDKNFNVKRPSLEFFSDCCNEFLWVSTYVSKDLYRNEILYANYHLGILRSCLLQMLEWKAGISTDFSQSMGKNSKYIEKFIVKDEWNTLLETFKNSNYKECWKSLFLLIRLFKEVSLFVAEKFGYEYPEDEHQNISDYLKNIQQLSKN